MIEKKKIKNLILQKSKISGFAQISSIWIGWILGVVPKVPEWKIAHIKWSKKAQNIRKSKKMRDLEGPTSFRPFENTLYNKETSQTSVE